MSPRDRVNEMLLRCTPLRHRKTRKRLVHVRRQMYEAMGSSRHSRPAHDDLDAKLERYLPQTGTFLEVGANDGYTWSNTYYLERLKGWSGVLIEGIPDLYEECRRRRPRSRVYNYALVGPAFSDGHVTMSYSDLCSLAKEANDGNTVDPQAPGAPTYEISVPARTLDAVLIEDGDRHLDFLSLDTEGNEAAVLRGLDLERRGPDWLLVEVPTIERRNAVEEALGGLYETVAALTPGDILYRRRV